MTRADCDAYLIEGRATAAFYLAHAVRIIHEGGNRGVDILRRALDFARAALTKANEEGWPPQVKRPLFRVINWLRADYRKTLKGGA